jgi:protein involved in polysaccharide export with SLBB domain
VNSMKIRCFIAFLFNQKVILSLSLFILCFGCSDKVTLPTALQLTEFENAGPLLPSVDMDRLVKAKIAGSQYYVIPEEVLELTMPSILQAVTKNEYKEDERYAPFVCRVSESGSITLPLVGELKVAGLTLAQIENAVIDKYYPQYAVVRPSVYAKVLEYKTSKVSITGAVMEPGVYSLRSDQMTLVNLIMQAKGIIKEGAAVIKITHTENTDSNNERISQSKDEQKNIPANQQLAGKVGESFLESSAKSTARKKMEVHLSFMQISPSSTQGILTVKAGEEILLDKRIDIADLQERLLVIKELLNEPRISILQFEQKLSLLADNIIQTSSSQENSKNSIAAQELTEISQPVLLDNNFISENDNNSSSKMVKQGLYSTNQQLFEIENKRGQTNQVQQGNSKTIVLPVKGLNIPFADIILQDGDSIIVEQLEMPLFSVLGLVNKPGNFQYPTNARYSLMQAIGFAGGLDRISEPRYATIYRLKPDGTITHAIFQVEKVKDRTKLIAAMNVHIKPGDIIEVEQTPRTRTNTFLDRVIRVNLGTYYNLNDAWQ